MKSTSQVGPLTGLIKTTVNDEPVSRISRVPARSDDSSDQGWDPFEVWRTRVKEPRERHIVSPSDRPKN